MRRVRTALLALAALSAPLTPAWAGDAVVAAVNKLSAGAPLFIALDKGYFSAENLDVSLLHLSSAQSIGLAVATGDATFGMTAVNAGIYCMAGEGELKMIAGGYEEFPRFRGVAIVASRQAYERGLRKPADLAGKKIAITVIGSGSHNQLARLAWKYGFGYDQLTLQPLQTLAKEVEAVRSGDVDASPLPATLAKQLEASGEGKIIGWMGDEVPTQFGGVFTMPLTITRQRDMVVRFVRAYVKGIQSYDRAFQKMTSDRELIRGENYNELLEIIARHTGEPVDSLQVALPYFNPEARLQVYDIAKQIEVYKVLKLVDPNLTVDRVVDASFVPTEKTKGWRKP